jgi:pSer/pThr/pTyr-binding forkhead associated (FHA) protein
MPIQLEVTALDDPLQRGFRHEFDADRTQILLGRRGGVDVLLPHARVSLVHARIERRGAEYFLADEGSTNGTRLNGAAVPPRQRRALKDGDRISIGGFVLQVSISARKTEGQAEASTSLARRMAVELLERLGPGEAQPSLQVLDGPQAGVVLPLGEPGRTFVLGRAARGDLRLDDVDMWRERAAIERSAEHVSVRELTASAQLQVNGERVSGVRVLTDGDVVTFGGTLLRFCDPAEVYLRKLEAAPDEAQAAARPPASAPPAPRWLRPEVILATFGVGVALLAAGALVYVLAWR